MLTKLQVLGIIKRVTGECIRMPLGHDLHSYLIEDDTVQIIISTARARSVRGGLKTTHRGYLGRRWTRSCDGEWTAEPPVVVEWRLPEPELVVSSVRPYVEVMESNTWARMCYRPGSPISPMDGPGGSNPSVRI